MSNTPMKMSLQSVEKARKIRKSYKNKEKITLEYFDSLLKMHCFEFLQFSFGWKTAGQKVILVSIW